MIRYLEDFAVGETFETGSYTLTLEEMIDFARIHDPQYFHTDVGRAAAHPVFRGISASGFLTVSVTHRLILATDPGHAWGLVGKGMDSLRWKRPVRPGDTLRARGTVAAILREPAQPFGTLVTDVETLNQRDEKVMSFTVNAVVPARAAADLRKAA